MIDDDDSTRKRLQKHFSANYTVMTAANGDLGLDILSRHQIFCTILDMKMGADSGFDIYPKLKAISPDMPVLIYTGFQDEYNLKETLNQLKPHGYFSKNDSIESIEATLEAAVNCFATRLSDIKEMQTLQQELEQERKRVKELNTRLGAAFNFRRLIGASPPMVKFKELCAKTAHSDITVLIQGETGTGKELVANIIHANGLRADGIFFIQNCAAIPEALLESELFGHKKGAFTGAVFDKKGIFEHADKGTIFLDEIGDMSLPIQAKLLRLLQEGEIRPVGSNQVKHVDVRVISATNKDLFQEVRKGRFREDLFYRLSVFTLTPPPLRDIPEDIPLLANYFIRLNRQNTLTTVNSISQEALEILLSHPFPGNVRELENEIERAMVMAGRNETELKPVHFSDRILASGMHSDIRNCSTNSLKQKLTQFERRIILECLERNNGNKTRTANELCISRVGLNNKLKRYQAFANTAAGLQG